MAERRAVDAQKDAASLSEEVLALEKKAHTLAVNAKYDASARDGQVKRSRILQTELEETREDNAKMEDRLRELERHKTVVNKMREKGRVAAGETPAPFLEGRRAP